MNTSNQATSSTEKFASRNLKQHSPTANTPNETLINKSTQQPNQTTITTPQKEVNPSRSKIIRTIWGGAGILCFGLGALGAVLPLIPTTPFILLAAFCLARSSKKLNDWFKNTKVYKTVFEGYVSRRTMTVSAKLKLLIPVTVLLGISFALMNSVPVGRIVVAVVLIAHYIYFGLIVKTEKKEALA